MQIISTTKVSVILHKYKAINKKNIKRNAYPINEEMTDRGPLWLPLFNHDPPEVLVLLLLEDVLGPAAEVSLSLPC